MSLYAELQRRKVFKVGAAYLVVAWLLIQVVATLAPQLQLPDWVPRLVTLLLMVGFPVALLLAWMLDVTPEGVKAEAAAVRQQAACSRSPVRWSPPHWAGTSWPSRENGIDRKRGQSRLSAGAPP